MYISGNLDDVLVNAEYRDHSYTEVFDMIMIEYDNDWLTN